ncbi:hypothetical protein H1C71_005492 [Ictidomys tridecemlineatus]|nr:hypothetical protein H1C71_005492 [Ictidomys tridecemlineatus]
MAASVGLCRHGPNGVEPAAAAAATTAVPDRDPGQEEGGPQGEGGPALWVPLFSSGPGKEGQPSGLELQASLVWRPRPHRVRVGVAGRPGPRQDLKGAAMALSWTPLSGPTRTQEDKGDRT